MERICRRCQDKNFVAKQMAVVTQENDINFDFSVMEMMMIGRYAHRGVLQNRDVDDEKNLGKR